MWVIIKLSPVRRKKGFSPEVVEVVDRATVLHYHLQRVRKGFPPCLEFIKASNMINNLYTWIVIQKKGIKAKDLTTPTFTIPAT